MSVAVLQAPFHLEKYCRLAALEERRETKADPVPVAVEDEDRRPAQFDLWSSIQAKKPANPVAAADVTPAPYVHPLVRRSSGSMSMKSLQICTESLGSETGSDDFSPFPDHLGFDYTYLPKTETLREEENHDMHEEIVSERRAWLSNETEERQVPRRRVKELASVTYYCSSISRRSPPRSFPPPLPSISRRDGPCFRMRPHRCDGRLVVQAVTVPSRNYLHAQREGGRLRLSFIDAASFDPSFNVASSDTIEIEQPQTGHQPIDQESSENKEDEAVETAQLEEDEEVKQKNCYEEEDAEEEVEEEEEEEEEEVEVVDRGAVVEVKVSTQPQQQSRGAMKVVRSSLVINKFVGGTPLSSDAKREQRPEEEPSKANLSNSSQLQATTAAPFTRRPPTTTATAAAAVVVASSTSTEAYSERRPPASDDGRHLPLDNKMLFTSKLRNREELLHRVRGCSQLRWPLFILEPCCIATSS